MELIHHIFCAYTPPKLYVILLQQKELYYCNKVCY